MSKKIDEAIKRFGTPDYGSTAKRLRDFENGLANACSLEHMQFNGDYDKRDIQIAQLRGENEALQLLLNEKDYEIDMLRNIKPVSTRDLWIAAGLVALVLFGAYYGFM